MYAGGPLPPQVPGFQPQIPGMPPASTQSGGFPPPHSQSFGAPPGPPSASQAQHSFAAGGPPQPPTSFAPGYPSAGPPQPQFPGMQPQVPDSGAAPPRLNAFAPPAGAPPPVSNGISSHTTGPVPPVSYGQSFGPIGGAAHAGPPSGPPTMNDLTNGVGSLGIGSAPPATSAQILRPQPQHPQPAQTTGFPPQPPSAAPGGPMSLPPMQPKAAPAGFPQPQQPAPPQMGFPPMPAQPGFAHQPPPPTSAASQPGGFQPHPGMPPQPGMPPLPTASGGFQPPAGFPSQPNMPPQPGMPAQQPGQFPPQMTNGFPPQPAMPGGMQPGMPPQQQRQRLDPNMMPSVVQVIEDDRSSRTGLFPTGFPTAEPPPLTSTEFYAQDMGNCNPKFIRSSLYAVPQNQDMLKSSQLPLTLAVTPIAALTSHEYTPPVVDLGELGPVRCQRCKAYICPFMEFIDGGRKFRCPFCHANTAVEDAYFAHLDHTGRRTDIQHRPELYLGSYEFVATKPYCRNNVKPKEPAFIFLLDVSYNAVRTGLVDLFSRNIGALLKNLPKDYGADKSTLKIGLATYDQTIHFYNLSRTGRPEMMIVNDVADVFVPFVDGFLVGYDEAEETLTRCLSEITTSFSDTRITETMLGPVIQAGLDALKSADRAGKLFVFHTSLPTLEAPGKLKNREDRKLLGTDKEKTVLSAGIDFYGKLGEDCVKVGCAVDLFLFPNSFIDIASLAPVCSVSGGNIYKYQYFDAERDGTRFLDDLKHSISRDVIFDAMMRVRTSTGIRPTGFYGSFFMQNTTDIETGAVDSDKSMQIELKYDDKLDEKDNVYIQAAILFTSCGGQRRLRIHNLCLPVTSDYTNIYRVADQDSVFTYFFKHAEKLLREKSPKDMREEMSSACAQILATYREKCSDNSPLGQLILPECLKLLPLYLNCILKNDAISGGSELTVDDRAWMMHLVPSLTVQDAVRTLYPTVLPLSELALETPESQLQLPTAVRASMEFLSPEEAYLIENGLVAFIWVGQAVSPQWILDVFNANAIAHLDTEKHDLPERDNAHSRAVRQLLKRVNEGRPRRVKLFVIKQGDGLESWMRKFLVEDRYATNSVSYVDFLCQIHREIRNILS